jgi:hypothetical protein
MEDSFIAEPAVAVSAEPLPVLDRARLSDRLSVLLGFINVVYKRRSDGILDVEGDRGDIGPDN